MLHDVFVLILYTEMNYKIYPLHYLNLNGQFYTNNHTYCKENKEGNQENWLHLRQTLDKIYTTSINACLLNLLPDVFITSEQICMIMIMRGSSMHKAKHEWFVNTWTNWPPFRIRYFRFHFREWKVCTLIENSLKFVPKSPIGNNLALA